MSVPCLDVVPQGLFPTRLGKCQIWSFSQLSCAQSFLLYKTIPSTSPYCPGAFCELRCFRVSSVRCFLVLVGPYALMFGILKTSSWSYPTLLSPENLCEGIATCLDLSIFLWKNHLSDKWVAIFPWPRQLESSSFSKHLNVSLQFHLFI